RCRWDGPDSIGAKPKKLKKAAGLTAAERGANLWAVERLHEETGLKLLQVVFGFMHARIQGYRRRENCFVAIDNVERAQRMIDRQLDLAWAPALDRIAREINPAHGRMFDGFVAEYYWSAHQSVWATGVMFRSSSALAGIYPSLVRHGMTTFSSPDVMRFLGGKVHGSFKGEIISDFKNRPEGVRIKHRVGRNSVKLYDEQGSVLRVETTINDPAGMKVFRPKEGDADGPAPCPGSPCAKASPIFTAGHSCRRRPTTATSTPSPRSTPPRPWVSSSARYARRRNGTASACEP
ncbi:MAG: hypothetical protein KGJ84_15380, partial [Elusimicrobia bacterium]|nr:hypothetical protein [Elusimicrobiota bacterium]